MRVLIVEHKTVCGGGQVVLLNLLRAWQEMGAPVHAAVVCPPEAESAAAFRALGVPVYFQLLGEIVPARGAVWNLVRRAPPTFTLAKLVRRLEADVVLANGAFSFLACTLAAQLARTPVLWLEHNSTLPSGRVLELMIRRADRIVTVSKGIGGQFTALVPEAREKVAVVYVGVDVERIKCRAQTSGIRRELNWTNNLVIGTVARLAPEKGIDLLIETAGRFREKISHARWLVVGDGPERAPLEQRAQALELETTMQFVGFREQVAEYLGAMDIFVLSSRAEGLPLALLEAMAAGVPVIAADVGGVREAITDGVTGLVVQPGSQEALEQALLCLVGDAQKRRTIGAAGQAAVSHNFPIAKSAQAMLDQLKGTMRRDQ